MQATRHPELVHALLLDGEGGAQHLTYEQLQDLQLSERQSLWLHWDRSHPNTQRWFNLFSGLSPFARELLLEENTRPRLVPLSEQAMLVFLRGVNLNPDAEPEDMVSLRVFADKQRLISLRLRPLRATDELLSLFEQGQGPRNAQELLLALARQMTERVEALIEQISEPLDEQEELLDSDARFMPQHEQILEPRRRAMALRRFLAPQREVFAQLSLNNYGQGLHWNELNNRLVRYLEELEMLRERVGLLLETVHRRSNEKMTRAMYLLGVTTVFFLPMSFVTGLLGINVGGIPGAESELGFYLICLILALVGALQWWLFRRWRWL